MAGANLSVKKMAGPGGGPSLSVKETGLPVVIAEDPLSCVALGTGKALDQEETFTTLLIGN